MYTDLDRKKFMDAHIAGGAFKNISGGCWDAELEVIDTTNKDNPVDAFKINIKQFVREKIEYLMDKFPNTEWLAYLVGEKINDNDYLITDLIVPSQTATSGNVYDVKHDWNRSEANVVGVIHSHHTMGAFFSGTDDAYINQNHDISIVVSTSQSSKIESQLRIKVTNDRFLLITPTIVLLSENLIDEVEFDKEIEKNISTPAPVKFDYEKYSGHHLNNYNIDNYYDNIEKNVLTDDDSPDDFGDDFMEEISILEILESNGIEDAVNALQTLPYKDYCLFNADVAENVLHMFEEEFPDDKRPRNLIEGIRLYHAGKITKDELYILSADAEAASHDTDVETAYYDTSTHASNASKAVYYASPDTDYQTPASVAYYAVKAASDYYGEKDTMEKKWREIEFLLRNHLEDDNTLEYKIVTK